MDTRNPTVVASPPASDHGDATRPVWVAGVRGGVGTSTIAHALGAQDAGVMAGPPPPDRRVVLVSGPSVVDSALLLLSLDACTRSISFRPVVAVVSDGHGRWPAATRARTRMVRDHAEVIAVPWVARWRWHGPDERGTSRFLAALTAIAVAVEPSDLDPTTARRSRTGDHR
ncbi:hypothetical protein [Nitriliruptor alkaliphilus]|uniref:hypothetical protein n=1 Tax=Nitriliruptor alkaliphilus TaxID=427918 RepID=UPI00069694B9|nr:hypothetical protein [Nitriliruptor alkaliphilus]